MLFWKNEKYEEMDYPLAFVELHNLRNKEIVEVLSMFDTLYEAVEKFQRILGKEKFERFQNGVNMSMDLIRKMYNNAESK